MFLEQALEPLAFCRVGRFRGGDEEGVLGLVHLVCFNFCILCVLFISLTTIFLIFIALSYYSERNRSRNAPERGGVEHGEELRSRCRGHLAEEPEGDPERLRVHLANRSEVGDDEGSLRLSLFRTCALCALNLFCPLQSPARSRPRVCQIENENRNVNALS